MPGRKKRISYTVRKEVILRCFFRCTYRDCTDIAEDLHHVLLESKGGSTEAPNLLGLCKRHHKWVHGSQIGDDELDVVPKDETRYKMAELWLAEQIDHCNARLDGETRVAMLNEIRFGMSSPPAFFNHTVSVRNRYHWRTYEIFLKAALQYNREMGNRDPAIVCTILYRLAELYRRRPGHQSAASRVIGRFRRTVNAVRPKGFRAWLEAKIKFEEAYLAYMADFGSERTRHLLNLAVWLAKGQEMILEALITKAIMEVAEMRAGADIGDRLFRLQDRLVTEAERKTETAAHAQTWAYEQIPIHVAHNLLALERKGIIEALGALTHNKDNMLAAYVAGVAYMDDGNYEKGIESLKVAKNLYFNFGQSEGRASVLVTLGDAYSMLGDRTESIRWYTNAARQAPQTDNSAAVDTARDRLSNLSKYGDPSPNRVYHMFRKS